MTEKVSAITVANYIVEKYEVSNLYLQKLLYFIQNNYMVENEGKLLFEECFQKWKLGPVIPNVYHAFKEFGTSDIKEKHVEYTIVIENEKIKLKSVDEFLNDQQKDFIDKCMNDLINYDKFELVDLTHNHPHWKNDEKEILIGVKNLEYDYDELYSFFKDNPDELLVKYNEKN